MKFYNKIKCIAASSIVLAFVSCTNDFDSINTDPNQPTTGTPELLLNPQIRTLVINQFNYSEGADLAHYVSRTNYNETAQFSFGTNESTWDSYYATMVNLEDVISISEKNDLPSSKAIAYILKAFVGAQLTDMWGMVPYFEAGKGADNITPVYDSQESIYTAEGGIIDLLTQASDLLSANSENLPSDLVYSGDREQWIKLANSLKLRYLMRISKRISDVQILDIKGEIAKVMAQPLMEDNADNFQLSFLDQTSNKCPIYELRSGEYEVVRMSKDLANQLNATNDPRRAVWYEPTVNSASTDSPVYLGVESGCSSTTLANIGYVNSDVSTLGSLYRSTPNGTNAVLMNASEVKLLEAEAVERGYASGDASSLYEEGIRLNMQYYDIAEEDINSFLIQTNVKLSTDNALEQILTQKWLSLFFVGYQAWFEYLRTGYPQLSMPLDNRNPTKAGEVPSRFYYPETEQAVNLTNYNAAISAQGGSDDINTKLWWEK